MAQAVGSFFVKKNEIQEFSPHFVCFFCYIFAPMKYVFT